MIRSRPIAVALTVALLSLAPVAALAQDNTTTTTPAAGQVQDNDRDDGFDMGWLGLLGLLGLAGLTGRRRDHVRVDR